MVFPETAVGRALRLLLSLTSYFLSEDKSPRFERPHEDSILEAYFFIKLNLFLQREDPLISRVHGHIQRFLKEICLEVFKCNVTVINENDNPAQINFEDTNNQERGNVKKGVLCGLIPRFLYSVNLVR